MNFYPYLKFGGQAKNLEGIAVQISQLRQDHARKSLL